MDGTLSAEDGSDPTQGLGGDRRFANLGQFDQLAPSVGPAPGLGNRNRLLPGEIEIAEPDVGVGLRDAIVFGQMSLWMMRGVEIHTLTRVDVALPSSTVDVERTSRRGHRDTLGPARPRAIGWDGAGGCMILSQAREVISPAVSR